MLKKFLSTKLIILFLLSLFSFFLLSFRITDTPMGLTADEAAFGWNAILLSRTGYDENGCYMPIFVNSLNKKDWRQPWTQYYLALFYKIFGASIFNLRVSSVILTIFSSILLLYLSTKLLSFSYGIISFLIYITTPIIFMHSHLGLDNIMPVPFVLIWLIFLYKYSTNKKQLFLFIAGFFLGASLYSYKGMRATVPVWAILSICYIIILNKSLKITSYKKILSIFPFVVGILPFIISIPILNHFYPGSIFGGARPKFNNIYDIFYPYLSHYDLTFLYIKGDDLLFHSTKFHGMVLLATLPLFLIGLFYSVTKKSYWLFLLITFLTGPLLYGFVESVHRASRVISIVPSYVLLSTLGLYYLNKISWRHRFLTLISFLFIVLNFLDFVKYYWYTYPKFTENIFGNMKSSQTYRVFSEQANKLKLTPYINKDIYDGFIDLINFRTPTKQLFGDELPPRGSIYLTFHDQLPDMIKLKVSIPQNNILIRP